MLRRIFVICLILASRSWSPPAPPMPGAGIRSIPRRFRTRPAACSTDGPARRRSAACSITGRAFPRSTIPMAKTCSSRSKPCRSQDDAAKYQKPDHDLDTIGDLFAALRSCWSPPPADAAREGMQMSVRFSFKRSGEIIAAPRLTFATAGVSGRYPRHLSQGDQRLARRLRAAEIHRRSRRRARRPADRDPLCRQSRIGQAVGNAVQPSFPDAQLHIKEFEIPGALLRILVCASDHPRNDRVCVSVAAKKAADPAALFAIGQCILTEMPRPSSPRNQVPG